MSENLVHCNEMDDHKISLNILSKRYTTNMENGLSEAQVTENKLKFGRNILRCEKKSSELMKFLKSTLLGLNLLLWICAIMSIGSYFGQYLYTNEIDADDLYSGICLFVVVLIAGTFSYYQEYKSSRIMESFKNLVPHFANIWRDGKMKKVLASELTVGDLVELQYGDKVPADIRLIECHAMKVDNSSLTGESEPQRRSTVYTNKNPLETQNLVFFSTCILEGYGKGIVISVGDNTFMGKMAILASNIKREPTPITKEMNLIVKVMIYISLFFGVVFFGVGLSMNYSLVKSLFFVIGIVVGNVPENLNVSMTVLLALAAKKMAEKNCLVKHLHAVETLGSTSVICSDKTGTLTENKMTVSHFWFNDVVIMADLCTNKQNSTPDVIVHSNGFLPLTRVAILNTRAQFKNNQEHLPVATREANGDSSEVAILKCMHMTYGKSIEKINNSHGQVFAIPFTSANKFQITIHSYIDDDRQTDSNYLLTMKGAPEKLIDMCSTILIGDDEYKLDNNWKIKIEKICNELGSLGERIFGFCDCNLPADKYTKEYKFKDEETFILEGFRFLGLISMLDPPRENVSDAVSKCRSAGIKVAMVTGDNPSTALAIAKAVGIVSDNNSDIILVDGLELNGMLQSIGGTTGRKSAVITGAILKEMSPPELDNFIQFHEEIVFARTSPEQKYLIVESYQRVGHVVAVTGDGVNDSPALKKANVGIAMGICGTDVAKEVADLVLLDDNFSSIVEGVEQGRVIFDNLKKLLRYILSDNIAEMYCYWFFIFLRCPLPMGSLAMLLTTLAEDVAPSVSLAYEPAESDIMKLSPRDPKKDTLITGPVLSYAYGQIGFIECAAGFFSYFVTFSYNGWLPKDIIGIQEKFDSAAVNDLQDSYGQEWTYDARQNLEFQAQTAFFLALVLSQLANAIACKTRRLSIFRKGMINWTMNFGLVLMPVLACLFIYTPQLNIVLNFSPIRIETWIWALPFPLFIFVYDELRRLAVRKSSPLGWVTQQFGI